MDIFVLLATMFGCFVIGMPIAYALALGQLGVITFDEHQRIEILMTIGQSLLGAVLLANMRFSWWEALLLFVLWLVQFVLSGFEAPAVVMPASDAARSQPRVRSHGSCRGSARR